LKRTGDEARRLRSRQRTEKVFLDANVLYSAAYLAGTRLGDLWKLSGVQIVSSAYAVEEAKRNLASYRPEAVARLDKLLQTIKVVSEAADEELPIELDSKDRPVLLAAIAASAEYLLTGDPTHFGHLYDSKVRGVRILLPADYLNRRGPGRR
jgi:uncharacterized protein